MNAAARGRRDVLVAAVLWSFSGVVTKSLPLDPLTIAYYRGLFAGLVLVPLVPAARRSFRPVMIPLGLIFGAMTAFFLAAIKATTSANAILLQYTAALWMVPLSILVLGERPDRRAVQGIAVAMVGIAAIVGFGYDGRPNEFPGILFGLASGVAYAAVVIGMRGLREVDPVWLSAANNLLGALALGAWILLTRGTILWPRLPHLLVLLGFGVIQMAIPYIFFARGLRHVSAPEAALIALLEPVLNPVWVVLFHGERPTTPTVVGGLFLLAGVAWRYWPARPIARNRG